MKLAPSEVVIEIELIILIMMSVCDLVAYDDVRPTFVRTMRTYGRLDVVAMINAYFVDVLVLNQTLQYLLGSNLMVALNSSDTPFEDETKILNNDGEKEKRKRKRNVHL